jgi:hypothetical protein
MPLPREINDLCLLSHLVRKDQHGTCWADPALVLPLLLSLIHAEVDGIINIEYFVYQNSHVSAPEGRKYIN